MISKVIAFSVLAMTSVVAFANDKVNVEKSSAVLSDESELTIVELKAPVPPRRYLLTTVRLKNDFYNGCLARDNRHSIVRLWDCSRSSRRYNWRIYDTYDSDVFYFVNDGYDKRCLALEGNGEIPIGPECRVSRAHLWQIRLPGSNNNLNREQVRNLKSVPGYNGQIQLVSNYSEKCLGTQDYAYKETLRALDCFQIPNSSQVFNVYDPGPIN